MQITKKDGQNNLVKEQFIEVKSNKNSAESGIFSENEWQFLEEHPNNYTVYHVKNVSVLNPSEPMMAPTKIKDFYTKITEKKEIVEERKREIVERVVNFGSIFATPEKNTNSSNMQRKDESPSIGM